MGKSMTRICAGVQCAFWASYCLAFAFLVAYLTSVGYSASIIGLVLVVMAATSILVQPFYGYLADKVFDIRKINATLMTVAAVSVALIPLAAKNLITLFALCIVIGASEYGLNGLIDCWTLRLKERHPVNYEVSRAVGSLGYAIAAAVFGWVFTLLDLRFAFYFHAVFSVACAVMLLCSEPIPPAAHAMEDSGRPKSSLGKDFARLIRKPSYVLFILCASLAFIGSAASISYLATLITFRGGTSAHLGYGLFMQAAAEVPCLILSAWLLKKFNVRFLLLFAFCAYILKFLAPAFAPSVWGVIAAQGLQGLSFGIFLPAAMKYLDLISPEGLKSTGTTLAVAVYNGAGSILGNALGGIIADRMGVLWVYLAAGCVAAIAAVIYLISILWEKIKNIQSLSPHP